MRRRLLLAAVVTGLWPMPARAQISPGPLSRFHQALEGARNCRSCHDARGVTRALCLTCHTALGQRIAAGKGLHAPPEYQVGCERCHVEHQGRGFELVFWGKEGRAAFDHGQTGFPLHGRHAALTCESCHTPRRIRDPGALSRGGVNLARTFLGLSAGCTSCHTDPHKGQFAPHGCADCHGQERWKPVARFDHDRTTFPLTGGHEALACSACHTAQPNGAVRFKGTPQTCAGCHRDPHAGRMGAQCATCHVTAGWNRIESGRFDHDRTRFALTGQHERVACARCHAARPGGGMRFQGTPFQTCTSCHKDPHAGRLGTQCATCHTTAGWEKVQAGRFDHSRTRFPLVGEHARVGCDGCHPPGRPLAPRAHVQCTDCHADRHAGQLASRPDGGRCESCHDVHGFEPARFSVEDHARTRAPLTGAHLAVPCDACHREVDPEKLRALGFTATRGETEQLRFRTQACSECHADPHRGQTARWGSCDGCHRTSAWPAVTFDHGRTGFPLAGAHAAAPCRACHPGEEGALALSGRPATCAGCHQDPHGGQLARMGLTDCARCHQPASWRQLRFDHDRDTGFPLQGAHRAVPCAGCHLRQTAKGPAMRYSELAKACSDCHGAQGAAPRGEGP